MGAARPKPIRLGEKLTAVRAKLGISLGELADKLSDDEATVTRSDLYRFENGSRDPSLVILLRYSRLTRIRMEIFADGTLDLPDEWRN